MDDTQNEVREQQQRVLAWALAELGLRVPADGAEQVASAIERAREIDRRAQAGLGSVWPYDNREERAPMPPLSAQEIEALVGDLQLRYERALEGSESDRVWFRGDIG